VYQCNWSKEGCVLGALHISKKSQLKNTRIAREGCALYFNTGVDTGFVLLNSKGQRTDVHYSYETASPHGYIRHYERYFLRYNTDRSNYVYSLHCNKAGMKDVHYIGR
jgi:hypothetical protein